MVNVARKQNNNQRCGSNWPSVNHLLLTVVGSSPTGVNVSVFYQSQGTVTKFQFEFLKYDYKNIEHDCANLGTI